MFCYIFPSLITHKLNILLRRFSIASNGKPVFLQFISNLMYHSLFIQFCFFQVRSLISLFGPTLQAHLSLAFQDLQVHNQMRSQNPKEHLGFLRTEQAAGSSEHPRELFKVLLLSKEEQVSFRFLLYEAIVQRCPVLAVLAACLQVNYHITFYKSFFS